MLQIRSTAVPRDAVRSNARRWFTILSTVVVLTVAFTAAHGFAQAAPGAGAPTEEKSAPSGLIHLILSNLDPVFWTIAVLSVTGFTLIIQASSAQKEPPH